MYLQTYKVTPHSTWRAVPGARVGRADEPDRDAGGAGVGAHVAAARGLRGAGAAGGRGPGRRRAAHAAGAARRRGLRYRPRCVHRALPGELQQLMIYLTPYKRGRFKAYVKKN